MRQSLSAPCRKLIRAFSPGPKHTPNPLHTLDTLEPRHFLSSTSTDHTTLTTPIVLGPSTASSIAPQRDPQAPASIVVNLAVGLYDRWVSVSAGALTTSAPAVETLVSELQQMTGVRFDQTPKTTGRGIFLLLASDAGSYPDLAGSSAQLATLATKTSEGFYIKSDGANSLYIVGNSGQAVSHGVYFYLNQLGWRALLPGENWTIRPSLSAVTVTTDQVQEPDFRQRAFFGTGAFGNVPLDPNSTLEDTWLTWQRANLLGGSIDTAGHAGEAFNLRNQAVLTAHPEYRPIINGVTQPWSKTMKPYDLNTDFQDLYVADRIAEYNSNYNTFGAGSPNSYAVSVEPADGDNFSNDAASVAFGSTSDHVFNLANLVAQGLQTSHPGAVANLYAYNSHAAVPTIDIEPNVFVGVVPYAFQRTGMTPNELLAAWAAKHDNLGVRDYWGIPDWTSELPTGAVDNYLARIDTWSSMGYDALAAESSFGAGSVGMLWYVGSRKLWDTTANTEALKQEFFDLSFGPAAGPMSRMINRWNSGYELSQQSLGMAFQDINLARTMAASDPQALARVNDYAKYVVYQQLYFEYESAVIGTPERHTAADNLIRYMWGIYDSAMVHTYRMNELIRHKWNEADSVLRADWDPGTPNAAGWLSVTTVTDAQLTAKINAGTSAYPVLFDQPKFSTTLVPMNPSAVLDGVYAETARQYGSKNFTFYAPTGVTQLNFQIWCGDVYPQPELTDTVTVRDSSGNIVFNQDFGLNNDMSWNSFSVPVTAGQTYTMNVNDPKKSFILRMERKLPFVLNGVHTSMNQTTQPTTYFYVPTGQTTLAFAAGSVTNVVVRNFSGAVVSPTYGNGTALSLYTVAAGQDGHLWSFTYHKGYSPGAYGLNIPTYFSFSPDGMMVPVNAAPTVFADFDKAIVSPTNSVSLLGKIVDDRMSAGAVTSTWTKQSGPGTVGFSAGSNPITNATFSATGTYVLRLTASDGTLSAYDEVTVVYNATTPNTRPVVNAGADQTVSIPPGVLTAGATLEGTVTDAGGGSLTYSWTLVSGPGRASFANSTAVDTTVTFDKAGDYILRLSASDGSLDSFDEINIKVKPDYTAPVYNIGDTGTFGYSEFFGYNADGIDITNTSHRYDARFMAMETLSVNKVFQRFTGVDPNTRIEVGIMADDGNGNPTGTYLASTGSYDPPDGSTNVWSPNFTSSVTLNAYSVYHVVTRATVIGTSETFTIYKSSATQTIRPYDRARDEYMSVLTSSNAGANWYTQPTGEAFFVLGNASGAVGGPGSAVQTESATGLQTRGGTSTAIGQAFTISTREVPLTSRVLTSSITMQITTTGSPTIPLLVKLKRASDGVVLGQFTVTPALADNTVRTWSFDNGAQASLLPGEAYVLTTEFASAGSTTSQYYKFRAALAEPGNGNATWGGSTIAYPVQSGASNNWATSIPSSLDHADLWFNFQGQVVNYNPVVPLNSTGSFGNGEAFTYTGVGQTIDTLNDLYSARFQPHETLIVDRLFQRLIGIDANTRIEVGIMADDGTGKPDGRFIRSTGSYDPANGDSLDWASLTEPITLKAGGIYHMVTRSTVLGAGDTFKIYRSTGNQSIRVSDKTTDVNMSAMRNTNGTGWVADAFDPYFLLGKFNGSSVDILKGPGQPDQSLAYYLTTTGGTSTAQGQRFKIFIGQAPQNTIVRTTGMTMQLTTTGAPTAPLLVQLRHSNGTVIAQFHVTPAQADGTVRTWTFENGAVADLTPGTQYLITTQFDGASTGSQTYKMNTTYTQSGQGAGSWGSTADCMPIQSGASNNWTTWSDLTTREYADLWFAFSGTVLTPPQAPLSMSFSASSTSMPQTSPPEQKPTDPPKSSDIPVTSFAAILTGQSKTWPAHWTTKSSLTNISKLWALRDARKVKLLPLDSEDTPNIGLSLVDTPQEANPG